jgi:hypothetical protein
MYFGVILSPMGWLIVAISAVIMMAAPLAAIGALADQLPEPYRTGLMLLGSYVIWPIVVAWLYKTKLRKTGRGSLIFNFYVGLYCLFFVVFLVKLINGENSWDAYLGVVVLGTVSIGLIWFAFKTNKRALADFAKSQAGRYEAERSEDIRRQAEAILLADEMKNQKNRI